MLANCANCGHSQRDHNPTFDYYVCHKCPWKNGNPRTSACTRFTPLPPDPRVLYPQETAG